MKHFHLPKTTVSMTDVWIFLVIFLFTVVIDVVYVGAHVKMGVQLSDYWLVCNVIFYAVELVCITAYNICKKLKPEQKEVYEDVAEKVGKSVGAGVVSAISNNFSLPDLTSGEISSIIEEDNSDNIEEGDSDEAVG